MQSTGIAHASRRAKTSAARPIAAAGRSSARSRIWTNSRRATRVDLLSFVAPRRLRKARAKVEKSVGTAAISGCRRTTTSCDFRPRSYSYIGNVAVLDKIDKPIADWDVVMKWLFGTIVGPAGSSVRASASWRSWPYRQQDLDSRGSALSKQNRSGTTTLVDWAHLMNTPAHADASVHALRDQHSRRFRIRQQQCRLPAAEHHPPRRGGRQARAGHISPAPVWSTMALAVRGPDYSPEEVWMDDFKAARALGLPITVHVGSNGSYSYSVGQLNKAKLLGPDITHVHCDSLKDDEYKMIADSGGTVSVSAESEMHLGCGITPVSRLLTHGIRPSISTDVPSVNSCDVLGALRITLGTHRGEISQQLLDHPNDKQKSRLTTRDMLEFATVRGAAATGSRERLEG